MKLEEYMVSEIRVWKDKGQTALNPGSLRLTFY
jgi:hypothetical protein